MGDKTRLVLVLAAIVVLVSVAHSESENGQYYNGEINASVILEKIGKGDPVEYDHVIVMGDLDLSLSEDLNIVSSLIRINDSSIEGIVNFNNMFFDKWIDFESTNFNSTSDFRYSTFNSDAYFWNSRFNSDADFWHSNFNGYASFSGSTFNSNAYFEGTNFNSTSDFRYSTFNSDANFGNSNFNSTADFRYSTFNSDAYFWDSKFNSDDYFIGSNFNSTSDFRYSRFNSTSDFRYSKFNNNANFGDSTFNSTSDFKYSTFNGDAYFEASKFNRSSYFTDCKFFGSNSSFYYAQFSDGTFVAGEYTVFSGVLNLTKSNIKTIESYVRWNNIGHLAYDIKSYNVLFDNYIKWRLFEDYDNCYYAFRKESMKLEPNFLDYAQWLLYGFGMKPIFPILWSIGIILISGAFFYITNGIRRPGNKSNIQYSPTYKEMKRSLRQKIMEEMYQKRDISFGEAVLFSGTYFSSGASNIFSTVPNDFSPIDASRYIAVLERLLGWFFFALFLSSLVNIVI